MLRTIVYTVACLLFLAGCAAIQTGQTTADDIVKVMQAQNLTGCIYLRATTVPAAAVTVSAIGTVGTTPPTIADCAKAILLSP
jgi:uncharacterized lipoprotein YajG